MRFLYRVIVCYPVVLLVVLAGLFSSAKANQYPEVFFGNSVMRGYYGYSNVSQSGLSWVENVKGRIPLSDQQFFTPTNSISLRYTSSPLGHWEVDLTYPSREVYYLKENDRYLSLRLYIQKMNGLATLPKIKIQLADTCTQEVALQKYISKIDTATWIHVRIPVRDFVGLKVGDQVRAINISQGGATGIDVSNQMYIDQVEFEAPAENHLELNYPAILSKLKPFEKHVELEWQLPLNPGIRYVKIYRSIDNESFTSVGMVPVFVTNYADLVPETHRKYYYKITWVDLAYKESPFSKVLEAKTETMDQNAWLDLMQRSHIQFFTDRTEINSGMHAVSFDKQKVIVSVEETGYALMAKVVGVERGFVSLRSFERNLLKLTSFLLEADQHQGVFPRFLDGRTGKAVSFRNTNSRFQVTTTTNLMIGLIVANQYLDRVEDTSAQFLGNKKQIQNNIKELWERVNWSSYYFTQDGALRSFWDAQVQFEKSRLLGGLNMDFMSYFLGAAHPKYPLPEYAYLQGVMYFRPEQSLDVPYNEDDSAVQLEEWWKNLQKENKELGVIHTQAVYKDTIAYGVGFELGNHLKRDLLETYAPFLVLNPFTFQDSVMHYGPNLSKLTESFHRRDNEMNAGVNHHEIWGTSQGRNTLDWSSIVPAISVASYVFHPDEALESMKRLYLDYGKDVFTESGFRTWFNLQENTVSDSYRGLNQAMVTIMLENSRTGLIWDLFSEHPDMAKMLEKVNLYDQ